MILAAGVMSGVVVCENNGQSYNVDIDDTPARVLRRISFEQPNVPSKRALCNEGKWVLTLDLLGFSKLHPWLKYGCRFLFRTLLESSSGFSYLPFRYDGKDSLQIDLPETFAPSVLVDNSVTFAELSQRLTIIYDLPTRVTHWELELSDDVPISEYPVISPVSLHAVCLSSSSVALCLVEKFARRYSVVSEVLVSRSQMLFGF